MEYEVKVTTEYKDSSLGKNVTKTNVETVKGLSDKGLKKYLKDVLDVTIRPGGKVYRPEQKDVEENYSKFGFLTITTRQIKKDTLRYQVAYDCYVETLDSVRLLKISDSYVTVFQPFDISIEIKRVC